MNIDWTISKRLLASTLISCAGLLAVMGTAFISNAYINKYSDKIVEVNLESMGHISGLRARSKQMQIEVQKAALHHNKPDLISAAAKDYEKNRNRYLEIEGEYLKTVKDQTIAGEPEAFKVVHEAGAKVIESADQAIKLAQSPDPAAYSQMMAILSGELESRATQHQKDLKAFDDFHVKLGEEWSHDLRQVEKTAEHFMLLVGGLIIVVAVGFGYLMSRKINAGLNAIAQDLSQSFAEVENASDSLLSISSTLSGSVTEQAAAVTETSAAAEEVSAMIARNNSHSQETLEKARQAQSSSVASREAVTGLMSAIEEMGGANKEMATLLRTNSDEISELVRLIQEIGDRTKVINDIVFQTKLLSFNASVEAARAGEAGKGFAVVAEEVGNLASMSGQAAAAISNLLSQSTQRADAIVASTKQNVESMVVKGDEKSNEGRRVAESFQAALTEITSQVGEMFEKVQHISDASTEQSAGMKEISKAMSEIDKVTHDNKGLSLGCSDASMGLKTQCDVSAAATATLLRMIFGHAHPPAQARSTKPEERPVRTNRAA